MFKGPDQKTALCVATYEFYIEVNVIASGITSALEPINSQVGQEQYSSLIADTFSRTVAGDCDY